jgi:hypothetical protein
MRPAEGGSRGFQQRALQAAWALPERAELAPARYRLLWKQPELRLALAVVLRRTAPHRPHPAGLEMSRDTRGAPGR